MLKNVWHRRYLELAHHVSEWSKDPKAKIGAVIADRHGRIVALGFNGFPVGVEDSAERLQDQVQKNNIVVHAEENAILIAGRSAERGTIYVYGKPVCSRCAGVIIQSGIFLVVGPAPKENTTSKWHKLGLVAAKMFDEAGVRFVPYSSIEESYQEINDE